MLVCFVKDCKNHNAKMQLIGGNLTYEVFSLFISLMKYR